MNFKKKQYDFKLQGDLDTYELYSCSCSHQPEDGHSLKHACDHYAIKLYPKTKVDI
jgi:hypothetical protein